MTQTQQPEALRVAAWLINAPHKTTHGDMLIAGRELRRLHACVQELKKELATERCLSFRVQVEQLEAQLAAQRTITEVQISAAAKELAKRLDYPWEYMTDEGRESMRENVRAVIEAAHGITGSPA